MLRILIAFVGIGLSVFTPSDAKAPALSSLTAESDIIVLAEVTRVDGLPAGKWTARAKVMDTWKGEAREFVEYGGSSARRDDISSARVGEVAVLFLDGRERAPETKYRVTENGRGRMRLRSVDGKQFAEILNVALPSDLARPLMGGEGPIPVHLVELDQLRRQITGVDIPLGLTVDSPLLDWVTGEPVPLEMRWTNRSDREVTLANGAHLSNPSFSVRVRGPVRECRLPLPRLPHGYPADEVLQPGETRTLSRSATIFGILDPGTYRIWLEYDSTNAVRQGESGNSFRGRVISNLLTATVMKPSGGDERAFFALADRCSSMNFSKGSPSGEQLMQRYGTSLYAGWALLGPHRLFSRVSRLQLESLEAALNEGLPRRRGASSQERIDALRSYVSKRPDFGLADEMKYEIAYWSAHQGDLSKALVALNEIFAERSTSPRVRERAEELLLFIDARE